MNERRSMVSSLEDRIELLDEMMAKAREDLHWHVRELEESSLRPVGGSWAGFEVARNVIEQWKAMANGSVIPFEKPIDMPREEGTGCA